MTSLNPMVYAGLAGLGAVALVVVVMLVSVGKIDSLDRRPARDTRHRTLRPIRPQDIEEIIEAPLDPAGPRFVGGGMPMTRPDNRTHAVPDEVFTVAQARDEVQAHRDCALEHCPRKVSALKTLIDAGLVIAGPVRQG